MEGWDSLLEQSDKEVPNLTKKTTRITEHNDLTQFKLKQKMLPFQPAELTGTMITMYSLMCITPSPSHVTLNISIFFRLAVTDHSFMTNGDMGDEKITVNGLVSDYEHGKRQRQPSKVLAGYELEGLPVRTWNKTTNPSNRTISFNSYS